MSDINSKQKGKIEKGHKASDPLVHSTAFIETPLCQALSYALGHGTRQRPCPHGASILVGDKQ